MTGQCGGSSTIQALCFQVPHEAVQLGLEVYGLLLALSPLHSCEWEGYGSWGLINCFISIQYRKVFMAAGYYIGKISCFISTQWFA